MLRFMDVETYRPSFVALNEALRARVLALRDNEGKHNA